MQRLNEAVEHFRSNGVDAGLRYVVFGASRRSHLLGRRPGRLRHAGIVARPPTRHRRASRPVHHGRPECAPSRLREPLNLKGHRRPRVLVLDGGLRTTVLDARDRETRRRPEHADLRWTESRRRLRVHIHESWQAEGRRRGNRRRRRARRRPLGAARLRGRARDVHHRDRSSDLSRRGRLSGGRVVELRRGLPRSQVRSTIWRMTQVVRTIRHRRHELRDVLHRRRPRTAQNLDDLGCSATPWGWPRRATCSRCRPYFPAALPGVIGVGGLDRRRTGVVLQLRQLGRRLRPGSQRRQHVLQRHSPNSSTGEPGRRFREWARWSGTSFAAPKVAGAIAQEMYVSQVSAREAWRRLSSTDRLRIPDLGVVFNI